MRVVLRESIRGQFSVVAAACAGQEVPAPVWSYARAMRCAVLRWAMVLRWCYAVCGRVCDAPRGQELERGSRYP
eukprot:3501989-Rhodomonas_salina.1